MLLKTMNDNWRQFGSSLILSSAKWNLWDALSVNVRSSERIAIIFVFSVCFRGTVDQEEDKKQHLQKVLK